MPVRDVLKRGLSWAVDFSDTPAGASSQPPAADGGAPPFSIADLVKNEPEPTVAPAEVPATDAGQVEFPVLYQAAGVPAATCPVEEVGQLIASLGPMDRETKRTAVRRALEFRGVNIADVLKDGALKLKALDAYTQSAEARAQQQHESADSRVQQLQSEIEQLKQSVGEEQERQAKVEQNCHAEALALESVLDFLTKDEQMPAATPAAAPAAPPGSVPGR